MHIFKQWILVLTNPNKEYEIEVVSRRIFYLEVRLHGESRICDSLF